MLAIQLKISDLAAVAGYTRFQLHGLLNDVFPEPACGGKKTRSQRTYSPQDLLVVTVACELERRYGVKRSVLASVNVPLRQALTGPRKASREARLVVTFTPPTATYLVPEVPVTEGLVLALGPLFARVDEYLGVAESSRDGGQAVLALSPAIVTNRRGRSSQAR
jgi:hypothetical protein